MLHLEIWSRNVYVFVCTCVCACRVCVLVVCVCVHVRACTYTYAQVKTEYSTTHHTPCTFNQCNSDVSWCYITCHITNVVYTHKHLQVHSRMFIKTACFLLYIVLTAEWSHASMIVSPYFILPALYYIVIELGCVVPCSGYYWQCLYLTIWWNKL